SLPVPAASSGLTLRFDLESETPEVPTFEPSLTGQLFLERPDSVGRTKLDRSFSYQRVTIDTLNGEDINQLHDTRVPICGPPGCHPKAFGVQLLDIDLRTNEFTTSVTYGMSDNVEVNVTIPAVFSELDLTRRIRFI